jgi:hypothetical protein
MPYDQSSKDPDATHMPCQVCGRSSVFLAREGYDIIVACSGCGDYRLPKAVGDEFFPLKDDKRKALVSHFIRKTYDPNPQQPLILRRDLLLEFLNRKLPTPAEAMDNALLWVAEKADGRPGVGVSFNFTDAEVQATVGTVNHIELEWVFSHLLSQGLLHLTASASGDNERTAVLAPLGWQRVEELRRAHVASRYAFFARRFKNDALDAVVGACIRPAVEQTNFELRLVTQRAGLIDATIEDEIRRCRFSDCRSFG